MDKKVFLLDKVNYRKELVENLSEKDLEEWVADMADYEDDNSIIKIDANGYDTPKEAIEGEFGWLDEDDYYMFAFGFVEV